MTPGGPRSGARERGARRARSACSVAERVEGAEEWLHACHREAAEAARRSGHAPPDPRTFYAGLVASGGLPDFPPDVLSALHQRYG